MRIWKRRDGFEKRKFELLEKYMNELKRLGSYDYGKTWIDNLIELGIVEIIGGKIKVTELGEECLRKYL